jgi:hypothetical protein
MPAKKNVPVFFVSCGNCFGPHNKIAEVPARFLAAAHGLTNLKQIKNACRCNNLQAFFCRSTVMSDVKRHG